MSQRRLFVSCLPALLAQFGFAPGGNPGDIPVDTLAVLGALSVREAQLDNAQLVAQKLAGAFEAVTMESILTIAAADAEIQSLNQRLVSESSRGAKSRNDMWDAKDKLRAEEREHVATKEALKAAQEKLAAIEGAMSGKKDEPKGGDGESGAPALH